MPKPQQQIADLQHAREIMVRLTQTKGAQLEEVAKDWKKAANAVNDANIIVDLTDTKKTGHFNYQNLAGKVVKDIDAVTEALKKHDAKAYDKQSHNLSEHMFNGIQYTAWKWQPEKETHKR